MRIMPPAPRAAKPAGASHALLEELLEAGETDTAEFAGGAEFAGEAELMDSVDLVDASDFADRADAANTELPSGGIDLKDHLSAIEIGLIRKALVEADGTVAEAARLLRMRRTTLVEKLRKYRLSA